MSDLATLEAPVTNPTVRTDWSREEIAALFDLPFTELVFRAAAVHRDHHRSCARCCPSRPAAAPKTAAIARKASRLTAAWRRAS